MGGLQALKSRYTSGWFTGVDRVPFEWPCDTNNDGAADVSYHYSVPTAGTLQSGPRWRVIPNTFGRDISGLEMLNVESAPPPCQRDLIQHPVSAAVKTVINLHDWKATDKRSIEGRLPLVWTTGWTTIGETGLMLAAWNGSEALVRRLFEAKADPSTLDGRGMTARDCAESETRTRYCRHWVGPDHGIEHGAD